MYFIPFVVKVGNFGDLSCSTIITSTPLNPNIQSNTLFKFDNLSILCLYAIMNVNIYGDFNKWTFLFIFATNDFVGNDMLDFGLNNLYLNGGTQNEYTIAKIINFYEEIGVNCVYFYPNNSKLRYSITCKKINFNKNNISSKIKKNLFRADLILIEGGLENFSTVRRITGLPLIMIGDFGVDYSRYDYIYSFEDDPPARPKPLRFNPFPDIYKGNVHCLSQPDGGSWSSSLENIITRYKRDFKLKDLGI